MEWEKATKKEDKIFEIPETWLLSHYYEVLTILFRIENALRVFVFSVLKSTFKENWSTQPIVSDDSESGTIEKIAKKRISQSKDFGYLGYFVSCPIMYLTTGELIRLIMSDNNWKHFCKYFLGKKAIMENKLDEIINIRNSIAHFRPIRQGDVEFIKQNSVHVLGAVEAYLLQITNCRNVVPTNTSNVWYQELTTIGTENVSLSLFFSDNEEWVRIELKYKCPIINKEVYDQRIVLYRLLTITSSAILSKYTELKNQIIYMSEEIPYARMKQDFISDLSKNINMVIDKKTLDEKHEVICSQIKDLLSLISEETDLIKKDNLAKGTIVKAVNTHASYKKSQETGTWNFYNSELSCSVEENSPPEFWGKADFQISNYISDTHKFPWMPVPISEIKSPW